MNDVDSLGLGQVASIERVAFMVSIDIGFTVQNVY